MAGPVCSDGNAASVNTGGLSATMRSSLEADKVGIEEPAEAYHQRAPAFARKRRPRITHYILRVDGPDAASTELAAADHDWALDYCCRLTL
jgi:hypothetical protein